MPLYYQHSEAQIGTTMVLSCTVDKKKIDYLRKGLQETHCPAPVCICGVFWGRWWRCYVFCISWGSIAAQIFSRRWLQLHPSSSSSGTSSQHTSLWSRPPFLALKIKAAINDLTLRSTEKEPLVSMSLITHLELLGPGFFRPCSSQLPS